jgi:hypothetical protein
MILDRPAAPTSQRTSVIVDEPDGLVAIHRPDVNLCVWRRPLDPGFAAWLAAVRDAVDTAVEVTLDGLFPDASRLVAGFPAGAGRDALKRDVEEVARRYARVMGVARVDASLATVSRDMCRKFHADYIGVRLLCTYSGPGTEWVDDAFVNRAAPLDPDQAFTDANRALVPDLRHVRALGAGDVGLLKGHAWPGNDGHGVVHRSAPVEALGLRRVVLKLDVRRPGAHDHA